MDSMDFACYISRNFTYLDRSSLSFRCNCRCSYWNYFCFYTFEINTNGEELQAIRKVRLRTTLEAANFNDKQGAKNRRNGAECPEIVDESVKEQKYEQLSLF